MLRCDSTFLFLFKSSKSGNVGNHIRKQKRSSNASVLNDKIKNNMTNRPFSKYERVNTKKEGQTA